MAFLFETRTLGSIASSVASEVTTTISTALDTTSPTLAALLPSTSSSVAPALETTTTSTSVINILETTTATDHPEYFTGFTTMSNEDSTFARFVEMLQDYPESSSLQDVTDNLTNVAISIDKQSKMEANIETLNLNLNHLFLLINGSLVILMQVNFNK